MYVGQQEKRESHTWWEGFWLSIAIQTTSRFPTWAEGRGEWSSSSSWQKSLRGWHFIIPKVSPCLRVWFTLLCLPPPIISSKLIHPRTTSQSSLTSLFSPPPTLNHPLSLYFQFQVCLWSDFQVCPILWITLHLPTFRPSSLLPWTNGKPPKCLIGLQGRITTSNSVKEEAPPFPTRPMPNPFAGHTNLS